MRSIVNPLSVCVTASVFRSNTVAQRVDSTCATLKLVNFLKRYKFSIGNVKLRAFFLFNTPTYSVNEKLNILNVDAAHNKAQFSGFGGWVQ